jgi:hypothetical protein
MVIIQAKQPRFYSQQKPNILFFDATSKPTIVSIVSSPMVAEDSYLVNKSKKLTSHFLLESI